MLPSAGYSPYEPPLSETVLTKTLVRAASTNQKAPEDSM